MKNKEITVKDAAKKAGVSPSLIYYYVQNGLLPKPRHIPNVSGRSVAVYPKNIVKNIRRIQGELKKKRSLKRAVNELSVEDKQKIVAKKIKELSILVNKKGYDELALKENLQSLTEFVVSPSMASTCYTGECLE